MIRVEVEVEVEFAVEVEVGCGFEVEVGVVWFNPAFFPFPRMRGEGKQLRHNLCGKRSGAGAAGKVHSM